MDASTNTKKSPAVKVIRDPNFSRRLIMALDSHPQAPAGHGRQKWLRDELESKFGAKVSAEGVRKYFAGEARPKPQLMKLIAQVVQADEAWLSLGITPDEAPADKQKRNAEADGAVNLVAGLIQMSGGHIAFNETKGDDRRPDITAIVKGKRYDIEIKTARLDGDGFRVSLNKATGEQSVIIVVPSEKPMQFDLLNVPSTLIADSGKNRGGYSELVFVRDRSGYKIGDRLIKPLLDITSLAK